MLTKRSWICCSTVWTSLSDDRAFDEFGVGVRVLDRVRALRGLFGFAL
jgi:hypothetical protein